MLRDAFWPHWGHRSSIVWSGFGRLARRWRQMSCCTNIFVHFQHGRGILSWNHADIMWRAPASHDTADALLPKLLKLRRSASWTRRTGILIVNPKDFCSSRNPNSFRNPSETRCTLKFHVSLCDASTKNKTYTVTQNYYKNILWLWQKFSSSFQQTSEIDSPSETLIPKRALSNCFCRPCVWVTRH